MYRSPFFETFFADAEVQHPADVGEASVANLQGQVQALTRNLFDLQLVVASLIETLHAIELADPTKLRGVVEEELTRVRTNLAARGAEQAAAAKARAVPTESPGHHAAAGNVWCDKCKNLVPAGNTTITANGTLCDKCAALG